jgi:hypothetical protein
VPDTGEYWVYEDVITHTARVHRGDCSHCNHGKGRGRGRDERANWWLGRSTSEGYGSEDEARSAPIRDDSVLENCRICMG